MTAIRLVYITPFSDITGKKCESITFDDEKVSLGELVRTISGMYENLPRYFFDKHGQYKPKCLVLHNGKYCDDPFRLLSDGEEITLVPPLAGG